MQKDSVIQQKIIKYRIDEIFQSKLFWTGLVLKLLCMMLFSSHVMTEWFIPFVDYFVSNGTHPYGEFVASGNLKSFPYPSLMLYLLSIFGGISSLLGSTDTVSNLDIFLYRVPVLIFDFTILLVLVRWTKGGIAKLIQYYWLSPVLFYISYIHGQLDAIPIGILFVSLYFLFKSRHFLSLFILGLGIAAKSHLIIVLPFLLAYSISERVKLTKVIALAFVPIITFLLLNIGVIFDPAFYQMVLQNREQSRAFELFISFGGEFRVYLVLVAYLLILIKAVSIKTYSRNVLIVFLGLAFATLILLTIPSPGWYFWIIPFFTYFFAKIKKTDFRLFYLLQFCYLLFYLGTPDSEMWKSLAFSDNGVQFIYDAIFTAMQTVLVILCWYIYKLGVQGMLNHKIASTSYFIGVGGNSGAGKSVFSETVQSLFSPSLTTIVRGDDMHRWERGDENWDKHTHLSPKANFLHNELSQVFSLRKGRPVFRKHYDHGTGKFTPPKKISPNRVMIFEGLHPFYLKKIREMYDLKVYISPEKKLHKHWKILRDTEKRGYTKEEVLNQVILRDEDYLKYIESQNSHADIIVKFSSQKDDYEVGDDKIELPLKLDLILPNDIDLYRFIKAIELEDKLEFEHDYLPNDLQLLTVVGEINRIEIEEIAFNLLPDFEDIGAPNPDWKDGYLGFVQLFLAYYVLNQIGVDFEE